MASPSRVRFMVLADVADVGVAVDDVLVVAVMAVVVAS